MKLKKFLIVILLLMIINNLFSIKIFAEEKKDSKESEIFYDDFSNDELDTSKWLIADKAWGGNNGGVVPENVSISNGILKLEGHGDKYKGDVAGIKREDGTRTGAAIATREYFGSGSYEVVAKVAPELGACSAIWTFEYEEYYPGDAKYEEFGATGSYYAVNHEIDIEMPGRASSGGKPSYEYALCNTWTGEKGNEYTTGYTKLPYAQNDGKFHKYRFDWHTGDKGEKPRVDFYFDDELITTNTTNIPTNEGRLWIGLWFPNGWAGTPDFDTAVFEIDSVKITPFHEAGDTKQSETYAKDGWAIDSFPEDIEKENYNHIINGDFEDGKTGWTLNGDAKITDGYGILTSGSKTDTLSQTINVYPKMTYTITADVITDGTAVTIGTKKLNGEGDKSVTVTKSGKVVFTFTTTSSIKELKAYIEVLRYQDVKNEVKVDNVTLYSGKNENNAEKNKPLTFKVDLKTDKEKITKGDSFTVTAKISEIAKNNDNGLIAITGKLEYDKNLLELDLNSIKGLNTWNITKEDFNTDNFKFVVESDEYVNCSGDIFEAKFKVKDNIKVQDTIIKFSSIEGGTGKDENGIITAQDKQINISIIENKPDILIGDIDGDGKITVNDLAQLKLHLIELKIISNEDKLKAADLDKDNKITVNDLAKLKLKLIE